MMSFSFNQRSLLASFEVGWSAYTLLVVVVIAGLLQVLILLICKPEVNQKPTNGSI